MIDIEPPLQILIYFLIFLKNYEWYIYEYILYLNVFISLSEKHIKIKQCSLLAVFILYKI
jgi:hypothetical protein